MIVDLSPDSVAEFKILTNNYEAEMDDVGQGVIRASGRAVAVEDQERVEVTLQLERQSK